jgi:hypothetical protein
MAGWTWDEIAVPELNSEPVNDAMFNRNLKVNERLNVNLVSRPIENPDQYKPVEDMKLVIKSGSDEFDLLAASACATVGAAVDGNFYDLVDLAHLDLDQPYWMQDYNEMLSYHGMQFTATGSIALSTYRFAFVTMFNKPEFDNKGLPYLYDVVNSGEWTLDYQAKLAKDFYRDTNGNNKKDEGDFFGLISCPGIGVDPYWASCDIPIIAKDSEGADSVYSFGFENGVLTTVGIKRSYDPETGVYSDAIGLGMIKVGEADIDVPDYVITTIESRNS